jgi:hypothetical protein
VKQATSFCRYGISCSLLLLGRLLAAELQMTDAPTLALPQPGACQLRVLSPTMLELVRVNTKPPNPASVDSWDFVDSSFQFIAPLLDQVTVLVNGSSVSVQQAGFRRRPLYAPLKQRDLRIDNSLFLQLATPLADNDVVEVLSVDNVLWPADMLFTANVAPFRQSPVIHINQTGYVPIWVKKAMVGYYVGSLGELDIPTAQGFQLVDASTGVQVYQGALIQRPDVGYLYTPTPYQKVYEADFSSFITPGEYRLVVPGLGASAPFLIDDGVAMAFARTYALGLYHQRCGTSNALPFTRFTHGECHTNLADVPSPQSAFAFTWAAVAQGTADYANNPRHTAPRLKDEASQLYPFVNTGKIGVRGGHHDAGDYSKYTINSAGLVHILMFAVDAFQDVADLDNLGLPESGDGISDLLQEAKWEADFLAKLQEADGGFYFLVYPRNRRYENNVLPDHGDPQVVWPKNTAVTAAGVAALAQCASSPRFQQQYPAEAALYLQKARLGWQFLTNAIALFGKDGAYQKITHYGDNFMHDDELAWAACEMFLATGEPQYQQKLFEWFPNPSNPNTYRWGWWRMSECWGNAIRSYATAVRSGRLTTNQIDATYLARCETEVKAGGNDQSLRSRQNAYGTSFPEDTKHVRGAGWYFSTAQAFDLTAAHQFDPSYEHGVAILGNLHYEAGCNPVNVSYVTGLGWKRQREIVHQYAQNDSRVLPPSGLPLGSIQSNFDFLAPYGSELGALCFPQDNVGTAPYPFYDRWADSYNVTTEFVIVDQARSLASTAYLAALTPLKTQAWSQGQAQIMGLPLEISTNASVTATLEAPGLDLTNARIVWEARDHEPVFGTNFTFAPMSHGAQWVEVEIQLPDGRRVFAATNFFATNGLPTLSVVADTAVMVEDDLNPVVFTFTRDADTSAALAVNFRFSGTATKFNDYRRPQGDMPEFVVFPAGASSATLTILPVNDAAFEGPESIILTLLPNTAYNVGIPNTTTIVIADNDLWITGFTMNSANGVTLTWASVPGKTYRVACLNSLADTVWVDLTQDIVALDAMTSWTDLNSATTPQRFYRIYLVR